MKEKDFLPILSSKFGIEELNPMQRRMLDAGSQKQDIILLSPTGSGKTIAFIMPVLKMLKPPTGRVQCIVIAPSRELVMQIAEIFKTLAAGYKVTAVYGGHKVEDEVNSLSVTPDIIVGTPGRLLDHIKRGNVDVMPVRILILDEFDKTLELGFEEELRKIINRLKNVSRRILTSATKADVLPAFLKLSAPIEVNFLNENKELRKRMKVNRVNASGKDKLESLLSLIKNLGKLSSEEGFIPSKSIIFANHRESAERIADYLKRHGVDCVLYHGALEQRARETALTMFNHGSRPVLVATDLAARGLDIEGVKNVIHYHQALTPEAYTHRNGRTARVEEDGEIYILIGPDEEVKPYEQIDAEFQLVEDNAPVSLRSGLETIYINSGKKEKVSKGDILGFLTKECGIEGSDIGKISVFDHFSLVTVPHKLAREVVTKGNTAKLKGERRRFSSADK